MDSRKQVSLWKWYWDTVYDQSFEVQNKRHEVAKELEQARIQDNLYCSDCSCVNLKQPCEVCVR